MHNKKEIVLQIKEWRNKLKSQIKESYQGGLAGEVIASKMQNDAKKIEELFKEQFGSEMAERELAVLDDKNIVDEWLRFGDANLNLKDEYAASVEKLTKNGGDATWDEETCRLTLKDITLNVSQWGKLHFQADKEITIFLEGKNTINLHERGKDICLNDDIMNDSDVRFEGSGTLTINLSGEDETGKATLYKVTFQKGCTIEALPDAEEDFEQNQEKKQWFKEETGTFDTENSEEQLNEKQVDLNEWLQLLEKMIKDGGSEGEALDYEIKFQNIIKKLRKDIDELKGDNTTFDDLFEKTIGGIKQQENEFGTQLFPEVNGERIDNLSRLRNVRKEIQEICVENMPEEERTPMKWKPKKLEAKCAKFAGGNLQEVEEGVKLLTKHGGKAAWELATSTLILENIMFYSRGENGMSIHLPDNATVVLKGKNEIHIGKGNRNAIKGEGNLTIRGSGTLDIVTYETKSGKTQPVGIEAKETLTIQGGEISIFERAEDIEGTKGVECKNLNIAGGELKVGGGIQIDEDIVTTAGTSIQYKTKDGDIEKDQDTVKKSAGGVQWLRISAPKQGGNVKPEQGKGQKTNGQQIGNQDKLPCVNLEDTTEQGEIDKCLKSWEKNGGSAQWNGANRTLILDNVNLEGVDPEGYYVIRFPDNSIIELKGINTIHVNPNQFGISTDSDLKIQGSGILNLISKSGGDCLDCVKRDDILQNNQVKVVMVSEGKRRNRTNKTDENEKWEKMDEVRDKVAKKGITPETLQDIKKAGEMVLDELMSDREAEWERSDNAVKKYHASEIKKRIEEAQRNRKKAQKEYEQFPEDDVRLEKINAQKNLEEATTEFWELYLHKEAVELRRKIRAAKRKYEKTVDENAEELKSVLGFYRDMEIQETDAERQQRRDQRFAERKESKQKRDEYEKDQATTSGGEKTIFQDLSDKEQQELNAMFQDIVEHYPANFAKDSDKRGKMNVQMVNRGFYSDGRFMIAVSGDSHEKRKKVGYHEYGHRMEDSVSGIKQAQALFLKERGGNANKYGPDIDGQKVVDGDFITPYIGKFYADTIDKSIASGFEVVSMGFQYAYTNPTKLWRDKDYAKFIYGLLAVIGDA